MSTTSLTAAIKLYLEAHGLQRGLEQSARGIRRFTGVAQREFSHLGGLLRGVHGQLATFGVAFGAGALIKQSAQLDQQLVRIRQTAGATAAQQHQLRAQLFVMAKTTGQSVEKLTDGFNRLVQSGLTWQQSLATIKAINVAMAVTGSNAETLSSALVATANNFNFNLAKPKEAAKLLDQMTVAGRLGNAELENLASIVGGTAAGAVRAKVPFKELLALTEALSMKELNPDILRTLVRSGLRMFTMLRHMKQITGTSGVKFFDAKGNRRDAIDVLADVQKIYNGLKSDKARSIFLGRLFKGASSRAIRAWAMALQGGTLSNVHSFVKQIGAAGGTLQRDLPASIDNNVAQTHRLGAALRQAADQFAKPMNATLARWIQVAVNSKAQGGLGLSGKELAGGAAAAIFGGYALSRMGSGLLSRIGGTASGVAAGKALQYETGVTPVFVTNWPATLGAGTALAAAGGASGKLGKLGRLAGDAGKLLGVGYLAYEAGGEFNKRVLTGNSVGDKIGSAIAHWIGFASPLRGTSIGFEARAAVARMNRAEVGGTIDINLHSDGRATVSRLESKNKKVQLNVGHTTRLP